MNVDMKGLILTGMRVKMNLKMKIMRRKVDSDGRWWEMKIVHGSVL